MKVVFVTGNAGKVATLRHYLSVLGIELEQRELPLIEPQRDSVKDVARDKAQQAYAFVKGPVIVQDSGFCIAALKDFPGPYTKYILDTIGVPGLLKLMAGETNRTTKFMNAAAYCDADGKITVFTDDISGEMTIEPTEIKGEAWSELWSIFIPEGQTKTLGAMDDAELKHYWEIRKNSGHSAFAQLADWLVKMRVGV